MKGTRGKMDGKFQTSQIYQRCLARGTNNTQICYLQPSNRHYANFKPAFRNGRPPVCPTKDMFCYFLPLGLCPPLHMNTTPASPFEGFDTNPFAWAMEYAHRQKMWVRKRVHNLIKAKAPPVSLPCAAMHVRRTDVAMKADWARQHFSIGKYLHKLKEKGIYTKNLLLFTDDQNALEEALTHHPSYNWMYLNISRHRGSSGGYENHIAASDPADEVTAMLSIFKLARHCDSFVMGHSTFADEIYRGMVSKGKNITLLRVDEGLDVFNPSYTTSEEDLMESLASNSSGT